MWLLTNKILKIIKQPKKIIEKREWRSMNDIENEENISLYKLQEAYN
jgi:hypothetical protein